VPSKEDTTKIPDPLAPLPCSGAKTALFRTREFRRSPSKSAGFRRNPVRSIENFPAFRETRIPAPGAPRQAARMRRSFARMKGPMLASVRPLLALLLLLIAAAPASLAQELQTFPTGELTIESATGAHRFTIEIATTPAQMEQGLMFRRNLAPDAGMLFVFNTPSRATMWMKNTFIPLDMLYIDPQGHIINIAERRVPESLDTTDATTPARAVLELNGGTASRLGIRPGDRVLSPMLGTAS
jgi:uncharacterized membrane protein (UPF0127 family)